MSQKCKDEVNFSQSALREPVLRLAELALIPEIYLHGVKSVSAAGLWMQTTISADGTSLR